MRHYRIYVRLKSGGQATAPQSRPSLRYTRMKSKRTFVGEYCAIGGCFMSHSVNVVSPVAHPDAISTTGVLLSLAGANATPKFL